jgi:hypothetical protein
MSPSIDDHAAAQKESGRSPTQGGNFIGSAATPVEAGQHLSFCRYAALRQIAL